MKRTIALALALTALLAGCGGEALSEEGKGQLWYLRATGNPKSAALGSEERYIDPAGPGPLQELLEGPESPELVSPFPPGTTGEWHVKEGTAYVDLSEAYGGLNGAELTLADGCIVLTLCQLDGVERVYITVEGEPRPFRDQVFTSADFLLDNSLGEETGK